jgi:NAD+ kinase
MLEVISKGPDRRDRWNRGMTKKELSDMALGVRELSKRLGTLRLVLGANGGTGGARMKLRVKTIIVITKKNDLSLIALTKEVTQFLLQHSATKKEPYTMYLPQLRCPN